MIERYRCHILLSFFIICVTVTSLGFSKTKYVRACGWNFYISTTGTSHHTYEDRNHYKMSAYDDDDTMPFNAFHSEIFKIILSCVVIDPGTSKPDVKIEPNILIESSHILAKNNYYEDVMNYLMNFRDKSIETEDGNDSYGLDLNVLEKLDKAFRGFIAAERKSRARLKLNYLLAGASSNKLDYSIDMLRDRCRSILVIIVVIIL